MEGIYKMLVEDRKLTIVVRFETNYEAYLYDAEKKYKKFYDLMPDVQFDDMRRSYKYYRVYQIKPTVSYKSVKIK